MLFIYRLFLETERLLVSVNLSQIQASFPIFSSAVLAFGGLFAAPGTGGKRLSVQPHFHCKLFVVRGAFFLDDGIAELGAGGFLCNLLQLGFVVLVCGAPLGDEGLQEGAGGLEPAVEIERGDQRLERVRRR